MSINRVNITGNLTRDPELKSTGSGMAVLKMGVAVNDRRKNPQTGEWEDAPNFIDVVMFGTRAESEGIGVRRWSHARTPTPTAVTTARAMARASSIMATSGDH